MIECWITKPEVPRSNLTESNLSSLRKAFDVKFVCHGLDPLSAVPFIDATLKVDCPLPTLFYKNINSIGNTADE